MKQIIILIPIVAFVTSSVFGQSTRVVAPSGLENVEGDNALAVPINSPSSARSQSLYMASNFAGPMTISKIAYRLDSGAFSGVPIDIADIQIKFSTFTGTTLSTTFAANTGSDERVVFSRGSLHAVMTKSGPPNTFDFVVNLNNPFPYDPAAGGLLVDITKFSPESVPFNFDAQSTSALTTIFRNNDVTSSTGTSLNRVLVAQFTAVPEPDSASILFLVCGCLPLYWSRAKRLPIRKDRCANPGGILS